jgi:shikimate dehydrogenase
MKYALIGHNIEYSKSKEWFESQGVEYEVFDTDDLKGTIEKIKADPEIGGFNVTTPYKQEVIKYLDFVEGDSVNCVKKLSDGSLWGKSFDGSAFCYELSHLLDSHDDWELTFPNKCAILGNGGVVPVIYKELAESAEVVDIFARHPKNKEYPLTEFNAKRYSLIVNTIPFKANIDINFNNKSKFIYFDLNYADDRLVKKAEKNKHCSWSVNGLDMLETQARFALDWLKEDV